MLKMLHYEYNMYYYAPLPQFDVATYYVLSKIMLIHENVRTFCASMLIYCNKFYLLGFVPKIEYIHAMRNPMSHFSIEKKNENHASFLSKIIMNALTFLCAIPLPFMECCTNKYNTPKN